ncbi:alkaline phosphatase family protein [Nesterenkonia sp.]|uniref:alkaline phosphatase family protein n=1 Tax=Nesterenkonia sp. TaxID=704201 RepID=UPI0026213CD1|nr:alkaline phosphatase family protein [Nesterenkonia sp.]
MTAAPQAPDFDGAHLRHVLTSAAAALGLEGFTNRLGVPESSICVVILADGLGEANLAAHTGHARHLGRAWRSSASAAALDTGTPTTTAASLGSLGTGLTPAEHGLVGYDLYAEHLQRVVNMLGRWDPQVDPQKWQPHPSVLTRAEQAGARMVTISRPGFRDSPLTAAALSGGEFFGANRIEIRFALCAEVISEHRSRGGALRRGPAPPLLVYLYVDELDKTGHSSGAGSDKWISMLESLDSAAGRLASSLHHQYGDQAAVLLTADHGMVNISPEHRIDLSGREDLLTGVRHTGGEPRMLHLYSESGCESEVAEAFRSAFGEAVWAVTGDQAIDAGWFGPAAAARSARVRPRIGDVIVAAAADIALFHTDRTGTGPLQMVGQHGSLTEAERRVPLLELTGRGLEGSETREGTGTRA